MSEPDAPDACLAVPSPFGSVLITILTICICPELKRGVRGVREQCR